MSDSSRCAVCGSGPPTPHLSVADAAGWQGLVPTTDRYGSALADIVRCPICGHMQLERFPSDEELSEAYGEAASLDYVNEEAGQRATARSVLARIERHVPKGALLDLGCWVGYLLAEAEQRGWQARGVEPSGFASKFAREQLGLDVLTGGLLTADLDEERFDAVVLGDVIEHLLDPDVALERISALLRPGGVVAIATPNAGAALARVMGARWWSVIPTHVHLFTADSLRLLLTRHGFDVVDERTAPKAFTVRYYLRRIHGYSAPTAERLNAIAERLGLADRLWAPDFRDRILVVARRGRPCAS